MKEEDKVKYMFHHNSNPMLEGKTKLSIMLNQSSILRGERGRQNQVMFNHDSISWLERKTKLGIMFNQSSILRGERGRQSQVYVQS